MKKILSLLGAVSLVATGASSVVACGPNLPPAKSLNSVNFNNFSTNVVLNQDGEGYAAFQNQLIGYLSLNMNFSTVDSQFLTSQIWFGDKLANSQNTVGFVNNNTTDAQQGVVNGGDKIDVIFMAQSSASMVKGQTQKIEFTAQTAGTQYDIKNINPSELGFTVANKYAIKNVTDFAKSLLDTFISKERKNLYTATANDFTIVVKNDGQPLDEINVANIGTLTAVISAVSTQEKPNINHVTGTLDNINITVGSVK